MRAFLLAAVLVVAGCLSGDFNANTPADLAIPIFDLYGLDLTGAYNCEALNACEKLCATPVCIFMCRQKATPTATFEEIELQNCFSQYCPAANDMGGAGLCAIINDMGATSAACQTCINNTYVAEGMSCSGKAPECHKCLSQAATCSADP